MLVQKQLRRPPVGQPAGFLTPDFLLQSEPARRLYHDYAAALPILDYHSHLSPHRIADDAPFADLTDIWLAGDHYKWRAMRANGMVEDRITGKASARDKFQAWADTVPWTLRNPLYHWTHLELQRPFGLDVLLDSTTAEWVWNEANTLLALPDFSPQGLLRQFDVRLLCTTDDPVDDLAPHWRLAQKPLGFRMLPTFRPDKGLIVRDATSFNTWVDALAAAAGKDIRQYSDYLAALSERIAYFHAAGCRLSDHGLNAIPDSTHTEAQAAATFARLRGGQLPEPAALEGFARCVLLFLAERYHAHGWTQQFHLGALRNTNPRLLTRLGADSGADSIHDVPQAAALARFLGELDARGTLARTILYNLNPADNEVFASMIGNFQDGEVPGKVQYGAAWWFLDQQQGMEAQLNALSNLGLLSRFVGMVTDSRSFLSFPRHEYFRRVLCNLIGQDVADGKLPADYTWLGQTVRRICYDNAVDYFRFAE